jgi:voltage-gated sodium channel
MKSRLHAVVNSGWFNRLMVAVILLAGVLAGLETSTALRESYGALLRGLDTLVLVIFVAEIALKIAAHGRRPWGYFQDGWNAFDFLIVAVCCLPTEAQFAAVFRLARGLRLLRLVTAVPRLQLLVGALLKSLGAMGYVTVLLALVFYIYGVAGVHLFGGIDPKHFGTLSAALLSLFRLITLDNWTDLFLAAAEGSRLAAVLYFVSFIMLGTMIMLNLFIGIIMNSMAEMHNELAERERAQHLAQAGRITLHDELVLFERQIDELKRQAARLRQRAGSKV